MSDLVEWLRLQLDKDERVAREADPGPWKIGAEFGARDSRVYVQEERVLLDWVGQVFAAQVSNKDRPRENARHIALHDPARVLREVEAKRRILERHEGTADASLAAGREAYPDLDWSPMCHTCEVTWPCGEILDMAWVYSDRPGYLPEWAPR